MFVDQAQVDVKAGNGGDGMVAFRREKFVPNGGPSGGDGGRGGNVVLKGNEGLRTLMDFKFRQKFKADHGGKGMIKQMTGRSATDLVIDVPLGTTISNVDTGEIIGDVTENGQKLIVAKGGRGGRGNIRFASAKNPAPEIAENGEPGSEVMIKLELKVLADVGLVGFPSVGKSTLLSVISKAKPKIAEYHFTTLVPNLGMVQLDDGQDFVVADLPGLIEGAADGVGLGFQFLRHVERTRVILHLVDMSGLEENDPYQDYLAINHELTSYDPALLDRPQIVVATKMDMPDSADNLTKFKEKLANDTTLKTAPEVFAISSITRDGVAALMQRTATLLAETPLFPVKGMEEPATDKVTYKFNEKQPEFTISRDGEQTFTIHGAKVEKLFQMTNLEHDESLLRFARQLRGMGIDAALRDAGAHDGATIQILDYSFEFME